MDFHDSMELSQMKRFMSENGGYGVAVENDGNITVRAFDAELLIRNTSDGKKCLYNIVGIKKTPRTRLLSNIRKTDWRHI